MTTATTATATAAAIAAPAAPAAPASATLTRATCTQLEARNSTSASASSSASTSTGTSTGTKTPSSWRPGPETGLTGPKPEPGPAPYSYSQRPSGSLPPQSTAPAPPPSYAQNHHHHNNNNHHSQQYRHGRSLSSSHHRPPQNQDFPSHNDYDTFQIASNPSASGIRDRTHPSRGYGYDTSSPPYSRPQQHHHRHPQAQHQAQQHNHQRTGSTSSRPATTAAHQPYNQYQQNKNTSNYPASHHRHSRHSTYPHSHPLYHDMPSASAMAAHDGHHSSSNPKQSRSRTTIPTQSGKWILGKTIGAGSMGKVKMARKEDGSEQVACKIIPRGSTDDGHQSRAEKERADQSKEIRTAREAAIVTLLNHPHICGLKDVVRTNYHWYMLFELVNGGQMLDYIISHGKLKEKQARKFSRQIASALDYCHRNSIVHRDLKIENILINKNGDIKIIDFGLSNLFAPKGHLKTFCGSLYFAAPELLQARAYQGPEVDVWSFGIVLYVLVCGKVPFDDQSMPALHAKIKKGNVDYPSWLSSECKHLISRMLVTDPKQRATMQEVMAHPWMVKGYSGPPDNFLPPREPLATPLEPEVIHAMQGFNFGTPESINAQLLKIIESDEYQRAIRLYQREKDVPPPIKDAEKKRGFGFDFYKRRNSQNNSRDTLTAPSSEALQLGNDPLNAFSPLLSIYYLVKEKQDRDRIEKQQQVPVPVREKEKEKEKEREREREKEREKERERERDRERERERERESQREKEREKDRDRERDRDRHHRDTDGLPDISPPAAAHTNAAAYEMPGEKPTGGRTRPRARTHGEDDAPDMSKPAPQPPPEPKAELPPKKEGTAAGLLRRFSTRKRRDHPERLDKDRSHPPIVQVHSPSDGAPLHPRKSFSIRRGRRDRDEGSEHGELSLRSGSSQPQHRELLSPPMSAGGHRDSRKSGLGRSTSVNSADVRRHQSARLAKDPPATSGSDQSVLTEQPPSGHRHSQSQSMATRAKSLGHARRESIQQRRMRREAAQEANVLEETDMEQDHSGQSTERLDDAELAKPVFLKGLFSVSTTSGKSVPAIRTDIKRVLKQLNVDYVEIKGGFSCKHAPSIDLNKVQDPPISPGQPNHRRRFSFGGMRKGEDEARDHAERPPTTPRTPGRPDRDRSYSNSETSVDSIPRRNGGASRRAPGETSTQVQSDLGGSMILEFEIFIVKVPLLSMHGIQFKRLTGNTWQYKSMADQVLRELRL